MQDRFILDQKENILFINFAGLRIEAREQINEMTGLVRAAFEKQGKRLYAIVNYEGTEIAPEIIDYYGDRIKYLQDRYAISTVRYSSSGFTRSVLRYLGAAKDLESNIFTTREEAIRAIQEMKNRSLAHNGFSAWLMFDPRRSILGKLIIVWLLSLIALFAFYALSQFWIYNPTRLEVIQLSVVVTTLILCIVISLSCVNLFFTVIKPLQQMEVLARRFVAGGGAELIQVTSHDEIGRLAQTLNDAAQKLRQDIERLSGLYHISLMMGTGTEVSKICELLTRKIARLLGAEMCVILLYDERERCICAQLPAYGVNDEHLRLFRSELTQENIATWVFNTGEPYLTNQAISDPLTSKTAAEMIGAREILAVPLLVGERTLGTLEVMNKKGGFIETDKRLVTVFASQAAHLLANAQLFERVRESEERYREIFENALDGIYRSKPEGQLVTINPALAAMLGYNGSAELVGANLIKDLFIDQQVGTRLLEELAHSGQALDIECKLRRKSSESMPARMSVRVVADKTDNEVYHLGIVKDITEQQRLSEQLIISERLAVIGELVAGVAHEVRNPLFGITTTLSALARQLKDREAVKPFLDVIMGEVGHLNHLMEQLLEHSRPIRLDSDLVDICSLIQGIIAEFNQQANAQGVSLIFECQQAVPGLYLDQRKIQGVFANLLDNALKHTGQGGQIEILVEMPTSSVSKEEQRELRIKISDTGAGISPENLNKIFEPFFTTRTTGTGLGLAIVRKAIHDHGGTIAVDSKQSKGTTFIINLPLEPDRDGNR
ncbi:MAG: ATP-binding protein [Acidobacteriota bacterium]